MFSKNFCRFDSQNSFVVTSWWSSRRIQIRNVLTLVGKCLRIVRFVSLGYFENVFVFLYLFQWWRWLSENTEFTVFLGKNCCLHSQFLTHINIFALGKSCLFLEMLVVVEKMGPVLHLKRPSTIQFPSKQPVGYWWWEPLNNCVSTDYAFLL